MVAILSYLLASVKYFSSLFSILVLDKGAKSNFGLDGHAFLKLTLAIVRSKPIKRRTVMSEVLRWEADQE